jgi:hypothetical protein
MKKATFEEYLQAKNDIITGHEYTEYSNMDEYGRIHKQYATEHNGTFYEINDSGKIEFWSDKHADSRIYEERTPEKDIEVLGILAKETSENHYYINLSNGKRINITKDVEHNNSIWNWKIDTQIFSKDEHARNYLKRLITEKLTGIRIIYHEERKAPDICGVNGTACRHPNECNTMLCSDCPIAYKYFAERDSVKLVYAISK